MSFCHFPPGPNPCFTTVANVVEFHTCDRWNTHWAKFFWAIFFCCPLLEAEKRPLQKAPLCCDLPRWGKVKANQVCFFVGCHLLISQLEAPLPSCWETSGFHASKTKFVPLPSSSPPSLISTSCSTLFSLPSFLSIYPFFYLSANSGFSLVLPTCLFRFWLTPTAVSSWLIYPNDKPWHFSTHFPPPSESS